MAKKISVLLICCLLLLVGCGESKRQGSAGDNPWDLFTQEEAEDLLGFKVEPEIQKIDSAGQKLVYYGAASEEENGFIQLSVVRNEDVEDSLKKQGFNVKKFFEETKSTLSGSSQPVEGFGDEAFWSTGDIDSLHILTGDVYITVSTHHSDSGESLERAKTVAEKILSRL